MGPAMTRGKKNGAMSPTGIAIQSARRITFRQSMERRSCDEGVDGAGGG